MYYFLIDINLSYPLTYHCPYNNAVESFREKKSFPLVPLTVLKNVRFRTRNDRAFYK